MEAGWNVLAGCSVASLTMGVVYWIGLNLSEPFFADVMPLTQQLLQVGGLVFIGVLTYFVLQMEELSRIRQLRHLFLR